MDALQQLNIAAPVADVFGKIEYDIIMAIARQLSRNPEQLINHTSEWRIQMLARMGKVNRDTARYIAQQTAGVPGEIESIINETITAVLAENGLAGNTGVIENIEKALTAFDHQAVKDKYNQVNTVMQYKAKKAYVNGVNSVADKFGKNEIANKQEHLDILNKNALEVTLGEKSRTEAIRDTIREMSDKGIPAFVDASGREWSPEAYVNMDIRNTAKNAALMSEFECTKELGQDVILVSSHAAARPLCAPYQGKFYSLSGKAGTITDAYGKEYTYTPLSSTSYGEPAGLFGINCGHTFRGVEDGMFVNNEEQYDEKENSEEYDKVVKQRAMEREIRKNKMKRDALKAAGDEEGAREYDLRVKRDTKRMTEYCEQNDLAVRMDRTQVYGYTDPNLKQKKKELVKTVDKSGESGIINTDSVHAIGDKDVKSYSSYSFEPKIHKSVQEAFNAEYSKAVEKFGAISTIKGVNVLNDRSSDEGAYNDNSGWISIRHAEKKNGLKTMAKIAQEKYKAGKWSTGDPHHVFRHEIGHAIQAEHEKNDHEWRNKKAKIYRILTKAQADEENGYSLPSTYCENNVDEFISECIAASYKKNPGKTVISVIEIITGGV